MDDDEDDSDDVPVGDLVVDLRFFDVRLPDGTLWSSEGDFHQGLIPEASIMDLPLGTVAEALGLLSEHVQDGAPEGYYLEIEPPDRIADVELHEGVALESYGSDQLYATISIGLPVDLDEQFEQNVESVAAPVLERSGASGRVSRVSSLFEHQVVLMVRFLKMRGRTVGDLIRLADDIRALLLAIRTGRADDKVALGLVLGGHAGALVGQPESEWLDAKKQLWELGTPHGNAEAAKDLSAMANAHGGMVVIPARTTAISGREVISEVRDMPIDRIDITQIRDVLRKWVFPPLPDLVTEVIETAEGRGRLVVAVGAHRLENWPHLVVGDPDSDFPVQAVSVWVRDGDRNRALTAPETHALMRGHAAGRPPTSA
jgi:hypothetical protein